MTKLLVNVHSADDLSSVQKNAVDIWSIPYDLAVSNGFERSFFKEKAEVFIEITCKQLSSINGHQPLFDGVNNLSICLTENHLLEDLQALEKYASKFNLIASITFQQAKNSTLLNLIVSSGFNGIELKSQNESTHLLKETDIATIGQLISQIGERHLNVGLSGGIEAPDIPRLLPFAPSWLGFNVHDMNVSNKSAELIRALIPHDDQKSETSSMINLGTDRLLVSDFVIPMEIGAYGHEMGRQQRVRFNIAADVERLSNNPEDMSHIFSYDLIMDGIRRLASLGHIALVETLAERVAGFLLAYPRVKRVVVRVEKLDLGPGAVGIEIERHKSA